MTLILADAGIPMIVLQWPGMICALIPVVLIEALLIRRWLPLSYKEAFSGSSVANLVSTIVGVPLAWLSMFVMELGILFPAATAADRWHWNMDSPVWQVLGFIAGVAWLGPADDANMSWMIPAALALLLIPSFVVSVWIERSVCRRLWPHLEVVSVRRAVFKANLVSYGVLFLLACGWLAYGLVGVGPGGQQFNLRPRAAERIYEGKTLSEWTTLAKGKDSQAIAALGRIGPQRFPRSWTC